MKIDNALIDRLASLSKLQFEGEERIRMQADLEKMLDLIDTMEAIDTEGIEPLIYMTDEKNRLRPDEVKDTVTQAEALKNAPSKDTYYFKVPVVISGE